MLSETFGFHPLDGRACIERNAVPKLRAYPDHLFVVQHAPELGMGGHVHYVGLDQFIGPRYVVTPEAALRKTRAVLERIEAGRLRPRSAVADGQIRYLEGVIEFYKARTDTKVTIAAERLALIAVLTLPITALSSVYGMNIIVNDRTDFPHLAGVVAAMLVISAVLLRLAKQQG